MRVVAPTPDAVEWRLLTLVGVAVAAVVDKTAPAVALPTCPTAAADDSEPAKSIASAAAVVVWTQRGGGVVADGGVGRGASGRFTGLDCCC